MNGDAFIRAAVVLGRDVRQELDLEDGAWHERTYIDGKLVRHIAEPRRRDVSEEKKTRRQMVEDLVVAEERLEEARVELSRARSAETAARNEVSLAEKRRAAALAALRLQDVPPRPPGCS